MSDTETTAPVTAEGQPESVAASATGDSLLGNAPHAETQIEAKPGEGENKTPEQQDGEKTDSDKKDEDKKQSGAPEEYQDFTLPDGVTLDDTKLADFKEFAKTNNLSQEQAQAAIDKHVQAVQEAAKAPYELWAQTQKEWTDAVKADPDIGGAKFQENIGHAARAVDQFGGSALREALNFTGAGNHPAVIKAFVTIGKHLAEGTFVSPNNAATPKSAEEVFYPTMTKK